METPTVLLVTDPPGLPCIPAQACVLELDRVIADTIACKVVHAPSEVGEHGDLPWIFTAIGFATLVADLAEYRDRISANAKVYAYVFDGFLSPKLVKIPRALRPFTSYRKLLSRVDEIFTPMRSLIAEQADLLGTKVSYMPIGVDTRLFGSDVPMKSRPIDVNGYGRQPPELSAELAQYHNIEKRGFFHHTNHMTIGALTDWVAHRAHFASLLRYSKIALAYAPEAYDPHNRFTCSFVGQRWYESMAAGCVIAGQRPSAPETSDLFDWPDALLELPDEAPEARAFLTDLASQSDHLQEIGSRNARETAERHDWRIRLREMFRKEDGIIERSYDV
ncbi:glycosyltransferase [Alteripontixanthobacter maritimus]|uniref:glycosyltransferase n=1 Tax=Alteripontixanthobacter maritimus TaxID=2161824 RepID=UPI0015F0638B|nr:glycosyltransferase [Alteripontixanthobacter maritimus]